MTNKTKVITLLTMLEEMYPHRGVLSDAVIQTYCKFLEDIPENVLDAAVSQHIADSTFFPSVADIRKLAHEIVGIASQVPTAIEAWLDVVDQININGVYNKPEFAHPNTTKMVKAIGWRNICLSTNVSIERAHFMKGYDQIATREQREVVMLPEIKQLAKQLSVGSDGNQ